MRFALVLFLALVATVPAAAEPTLFDKIEAKLGKPMDANQKTGVVEYSRRAKASLLNAQRHYVETAAERLSAPPSIIREAVPQSGAPVDGKAVAAALEKEWTRKLTADQRKNLDAIDAEHKELTERILAAWRGDMARSTGLPETAFAEMLP